MQIDESLKKLWYERSFLPHTEIHVIIILNFVQPTLFCIPKSIKYSWTSITTISHLILFKATQEIILQYYHFLAIKPLELLTYCNPTLETSVMAVCRNNQYNFPLDLQYIYTCWLKYIKASYSLSICICSINWRKILLHTELRYYIWPKDIGNEAQIIYHKKELRY